MEISPKCVMSSLMGVVSTFFVILWSRIPAQVCITTIRRSDSNNLLLERHFAQIRTFSKPPWLMNIKRNYLNPWSWKSSYEKNYQKVIHPNFFVLKYLFKRSKTPFVPYSKVTKKRKNKVRTSKFSKWAQNFVWVVI